MLELAELFLSLCGVVEAEGRLLRLNALRLIRACLLLFAALLAGIAALAFLVAALYKLLELWLPNYLVLLALALVCMLLCAGLIWSAGKCGKKKRTVAKTN